MHAAGLDEHGEAVIAKLLHQRQGIFLEQRLAAGQFDERKFGTRGTRPSGEWFGQLADFFQNFRERLFFALGEGVGGVAVGAAQVAGGEPDEDARQAGEGAFALEAQIDFVDDEGAGHARSLAGRAEK